MARQDSQVDLIRERCMEIGAGWLAGEDWILVMRAGKDVGEVIRSFNAAVSDAPSVLEIRQDGNVGIGT